MIGREGDCGWCKENNKVNYKLCIYKIISFPEDPYEKKLGSSFYRKIRKEGEDLYDGIATSLGMWDKLEYDATREYLKQNGGFTPVPVSTNMFPFCEHDFEVYNLLV